MRPRWTRWPPSVVRQGDAVRFCHVTTFYPPYNFGGDGIAVQRLAEALARRGHEVTVVHALDAYRALRRSPMPEAPPDGAVQTVALDSRWGPVGPLLSQQLGRPVVHARHLGRILDGGNFDVVNFHNVSLIGGPAVLGVGDAVKLYTAHEHWLVCPTHVLWRHDREPCDVRQCVRCTLHHHRPPQLWRATGSVARWAADVDVFITLSEFSRNKHAAYGFETPMEVLPCFTADPDVSAPGGGSLPAPQRPFVLYAGRLERMKGLDDVIASFDRELGVDLVIAGQGVHERELRRLALGHPAIRFVGWRSRGELADLYRTALAVVVPTIGYETFGQSVIEAFGHGCPVIGRRTGPLPELIDGSGGGELFDVGSEFNAIVRRWHASPAVRARHGRAARTAFLASYCEDVVVPQYLELVRLGARRRGRADLVEALAAHDRRPEVGG